VTAYDRSELILASIDNLKHTLIEELAVVALVILIFLWHVPSAIIPIVTIPVAVLIAFVPMRLMGINARTSCRWAASPSRWGPWWMPPSWWSSRPTRNWKAATRAGRAGDYQRAINRRGEGSGRASFFALLVIAVSFLPVLTLEAQEGRLFKPLAYTKNFAMIVAAVLAITLDPAMRLLFFRKESFRFRPHWLAGWPTGCWWAKSTRKTSTPSAAC
jgi:Cu(I)/Ag(I) efflux system membrane protein CusA/SilA